VGSWLSAVDCYYSEHLSDYLHPHPSPPPSRGRGLKEGIALMLWVIAILILKTILGNKWHPLTQLIVVFLTEN
jgi:hypothetical protein